MDSFFANTKLGKFYLCSGWNKSKWRFDFNWIQVKEFFEILPSSAVIEKEYFLSCKRCIKNENPNIQKSCKHKRKISAVRSRGVFYSNNHFAKKISFIIGWIPYFEWSFKKEQGLIVKPVYAFPLFILINFLSLKIFGLPFLFGTVSTFNPDADPETTTVDGDTEWAGTQVAWATARGNTGTTVTDSAVSAYFGRFRAGTTSGWYNGFERGIYLFNTGPTISAGATINATSSTKFTGVSSQNATDDPTFNQGGNITSSNPASNTAIVTADHNIANFGSTAWSDAIDLGSWAVMDSPNVFVLNATGRAGIAIGSGVTKIGTMLTSDLSGVEPTWASGVASSVRIYTSENGTSKPELSVDWTALIKVSVYKNNLRPRIFGPGLAR